MTKSFYKLDDRQREDIEDRIMQLAQSYTPEWKPDLKLPDVGTTLGILYAKQMFDNIISYNNVVDRCKIELANILGVTQLPPTPASTPIQFQLLENTVPGVLVKARTKLYGEGLEAPVIFETKKPLYVTSSKVKNIMMVEGETGKIVPILGDIREQPLLPEENEEQSEEEDNQELNPFGLFDFQKNSIEKNVFLVYHTRIFDVENQDIFVKIEGNEKFLDEVARGEYEISYYAEEKFLPVRDVKVHGDIISFRKDKQCEKFKIDQEYSVIAFTAKKTVTEPVDIRKISFSSKGDWEKPTYSGNGTIQLKEDEFEPFGNTISIFKEWYFGHRDYCAKVGSRVSVRFQVKYETYKTKLQAEEEDTSLKIIKRVPGRKNQIPTSDTYIQEVAVEYFNGIGWKRLECDKDVNKMFESAEDGEYEFSFISPKDWRELDEGPEQQRNIRIRILRAENCYLIPCIHHYPVISNLKLSYTYEGKYLKADRIERISGLKRTVLEKERMLEKKFQAFVPYGKSESTLYIGLMKKPEDGPVSIYFSIDENARFKDNNVVFEYSTNHGFKQFQVEDHTEGIKKSGVIRFIPPEDMAKYDVEGVRDCWIRIVKRKKSDKKEKHPVIENILLNVVEVENVETHERDNFYLNEITSNMNFRLGYDGVYDAEIWVNEADSLTKEEIFQLKENRPMDILIEKDIFGEPHSIFVRWSEVDNFLCSTIRDRHYVLDRVNGEVLFGDGVHVKIPSVMNDVAFFAKVSRCDGESGNQEAGMISDLSGTIRFMESVDNFLPSAGGTNLETVQNALIRATNLMSSRRRLVTLKDYIKEILTMSDQIHQVACVRDRLIDGSVCIGDISLIIQQKTMINGAGIFQTILDRVQTHIFDHCELTIPKEKIHFVEPIRVRISTEIWIRQDVDDDDFILRKQIQMILSEYLDPIRGNRGQGYEIGKMPRRIQIENKIDELSFKNKICKIVIIASYADGQGNHECDIEELPENPFFICCNGTHKIKGFSV